MKHCLLLFVSLSVIFTTKSIPLRIQKRATFYVANETACVVDNIVYSNGEPIPSDDPCERCKCRPPGFACNRDECRPKPGCRAIRQVGQCCPKYECGCEHNGKMYRDGEQIRDEKNPCYECHCQGSSIACAFVDCFFRVDCIPVYVPGQCCPSYKNCSRDEPEKTSLVEETALRPGNLLPGLYGETILAREPTYISPEVPKLPDPSQPPTDAPEEILKEPIKIDFTETKVQEDALPSESKIEEKTPETFEILVPEEKKDEDIKKEDSVEDIPDKNTGEENELLFNSEKNINKKEEKEISKPDEKEEKPLKNEIVTESTEEKAKEILTTTVSNIYEEAPESHTSVESIEVPVTEKPVKNSAADNGKSLKLTEDGKKQIVESLKEDPVVHILNDESKPATEELAIKADKTESVATVDELRSIVDPKPISIISQNDKVVKKESAETVTIVVHVKDKTKLTTEKDISIPTTVVPELSSKESLFKSNDKLENIEVTVKPVSTEIFFEIFVTSTEAKESSTSNPNIPKNTSEARSDDEPTNEQKEATKENTDLKSDGDTATESPKENNAEASKEERTDDVIIEDFKESPKASEEEKKSEVPSQAAEQKEVVKPEEILENKEIPGLIESEILKSEALIGSEEKPVQIEEIKEPEKVEEDKVHEPNDELELKAEPKSEESVEKTGEKKVSESEESKFIIHPKEKVEDLKAVEIQVSKIKEPENQNVEEKDKNLKSEKRDDELETGANNESPVIKESLKSEKNFESRKSEEISTPEGSKKVEEISTAEEREKPLEEEKPEPEVLKKENINEDNKVEESKSEELSEKREESAEDRIEESKPKEYFEEPVSEEKLRKGSEIEEPISEEKSNKGPKPEGKINELKHEEPKLEGTETEPKVTDKIVDSTNESRPLEDKLEFTTEVSKNSK